MIRWSIERPDVQVFTRNRSESGDNREFMRELRKVLNRSLVPTTPVFVVKVGAKFIMRTESSLGLTGRRLYTQAISAAGL